MSQSNKLNKPDSLNIKIIIAAHKKYRMPQDDIYLPIHVGAEGKAPIGYQGDNMYYKYMNECIQGYVELDRRGHEHNITYHGSRYRQPFRNRNQTVGAGR